MLTARPATPADAPDVVALQHRWDTHWFGAAEHDEADLRADLRRAEPLADRSRLLLDGDRLVAAGGWWRPDDPTILVDPETDTGAAARELMVWLARSGADAVEVLSRDTVLRDVLADLGWVHARSQFELIRPAGDLPAPRWPEGVTVSTLADDAEEVHRLVYEQAGWADVPGHTTRDLEEWRSLFVTGADPSQQVLARLDGGLVGAAMGRVFPDGTGWVAQVAVHRDHQGRGLGSALLTESFARRAAAGATQVGLGVSATNAGALRLYERLGLTIDREWMVYRGTPAGPLSVGYAGGG